MRGLVAVGLEVGVARAVVERPFVARLDHGAVARRERDLHVGGAVLGVGGIGLVAAELDELVVKLVGVDRCLFDLGVRCDFADAVALCKAVLDFCAEILGVDLQTVNRLRKGKSVLLVGTELGDIGVFGLAVVFLTELADVFGDGVVGYGRRDSVGSALALARCELIVLGVVLHLRENVVNIVGIGKISFLELKVLAVDVDVKGDRSDELVLISLQQLLCKLNGSV